MRLILAAVCLFSISQAYAGDLAGQCPNPSKVLGVSRIIEIDTSGGALFGTIQYGKTVNLQKGEVILTFDDGPHPQYTAKILEALKIHCTKATFFPVGQMIRAYPKTLAQVANAGHTIGGHSYRHPNLARLSNHSAIIEIEKGFNAALEATGKPVAPFFRFPFLSDTKRLKGYLATRNIAVFSVDIVSNDSYISSSGRLVRTTMAQLKKKGGGIILFHDIKRSTARGLLSFLNKLKSEGFKVVHMVPKFEITQAAPLTLTKSEAADKQPELKPKSSPKAKPKSKRRFGPWDVFDFAT